MYKILEAKNLVPKIHEIKIEAPAVARKAEAGQFVVVMIDDKGERIPLTVADYDREEGSITIVFMEVGTTSSKLAQLKTGDSIASFTGPLGLPTHIDKVGTIVCVGGGIGVAPITPIARSLRAAGNKIISIQGSRSKDLLFWQDRLAAVSDEHIVCTDDGTFGRMALVTEPLKELLESDKSIKKVIAIGPVPMMKFSCKTTEPFGVETIVSLNPIMVDGTGMCGCCRVEVENETKFTCVHGPDFDGHKVDWDLLAARQRTYLDDEKRSLELWEQRTSECSSEGRS